MQDRRYPRTARLNELVREVLADEIERLSDPRLGFVTVTGCDVTPDLRHATVYYSVLGPAEAHEGTGDALRDARVHLQAVLGRQVRMKYTPTLAFREDPALATAQRVEQIIRTLDIPEDEAPA
ncbi:MAG: 30S ribosome-binding factor RbfA [Acidimicrobiia bacterium]